jgi:hypothetical protein
MSGPGRSGSYSPAARYSYTVDGVTYESARWRFGGAGMNRQDLSHAMSTDIKPIDPVAFYDPERPGRSCLVAGLDEATFALPIILSLMAATALVGEMR